MCGIIGVLGELPKQEKFIKARDEMMHRGPDDAGVFYDNKDGIALGHRRLAIIDLSKSGRQPFASNDGRFILVFNGEIYNYLELRKELESWYNFKTNTDTEVLLATYIKWGEKSLQRLQGMFAFSIWDKKNKSLFIARDRLGIKPLYYAENKNSFYFSSEIKGILKFNVIPRYLNKQAFLDYLSYRYVLGKFTFFKGIYSLLPGYCAIIKKNKKIKIKKYWDLPVISDKYDPSEEVVLKETEDLLWKTVRSHMISDAPLGAYLSGGLDSSLLVAMMSKISSKKIKTFSIGFKEDGFNEFKYARKVAKHVDADHTEIILQGNDYVDLLQESISFKDTPLSVPNEVAVHMLSKKLKEHISVVLSGEGADELFGGYGRLFRSGYDLERIRLLQLGSDFLKNHDKVKLLYNLKLKYPILKNYSDLDHFINEYTYCDFTDKKKLLNKEYFISSKVDFKSRGYFDTINSKLSTLSLADKYIYHMQKIHIVGLLHRLDSMTMSRSVEARVPFVDHKLVEYVSALPLKYKIAWKSDRDKKLALLENSNQISEIHDITKYILRKIASKYLPVSIIKRKKVGFPVPLDEWFNGDFSNMAKEILLSNNALSKDLYNVDVLKKVLNNNVNNNLSTNFKSLNIWMLINMEIWMKKYNLSL